MISNEDLRLQVHLDDEEGQGLVVLIIAPTEEDPPMLFSVDGVIRLLEAGEGF